MLDSREARAGLQQRELQPKEGGDDRLPTWMGRAFFAASRCDVVGNRAGRGILGVSIRVPREDGPAMIHQRAKTFWREALVRFHTIVPAAKARSTAYTSNWICRGT
jgi:hypothetical protein